jgi:hypothetical protein
MGERGSELVGPGPTWTFVVSAVLAACGTEPNLGGEGESCTSREDCRQGLACVQQVCAARAAELGAGQVGEDCQAPTDCAPELACVEGTCIRAESALSPTGKACYAVECSADADCCASFVPSPNCASYEAECATNPTACASYRLLCECNRGCEDDRCVDTPLGCESSEECVSFSAPFCVAGACRECAEHGDCPGEGSRCLAGRCEAPCVVDEQCPLFHACEIGECVEVGCQSDRECALYLNDDRARCAEGACGVPCEADWQCSSEPGQLALDVCVEGVCTFVGCETDAECRAYLGLENELGGVEAVCR